MAMAADLGFEATELRLGLPGGGGGDGETAAARSSSGKRGFAETIDLKLKLEPAAAAHQGQWRNARTEAEKEEHEKMLEVLEERKNQKERITRHAATSGSFPGKRRKNIK
uniref:Auxin-responsive protein n=1 Tax=Oryza punctata TaxID=4537 RepID=A0A0E0MPC5_ORYPU